MLEELKEKLIPSIRVLHDKPVVAPLVKKFSALTKPVTPLKPLLEPRKSEGRCDISKQNVN
jgi:hypothetical protein